jgi:geranylgeranyl pyrophosphate synthase
VDDALDFSAPEEVSGKPRGGDLREGKFTLPLLLYLESLDQASRAEFAARITGRSLDESSRVEHPFPHRAPRLHRKDKGVRPRVSRHSKEGLDALS